MANDLNRCDFIGRLGGDVELKYMPSGKAVCNTSIACGKSWKNKDTGQKEEKTTWVRVVAFGRLAEVMAQYLGKGSQVYISGELSERKWEDKNGTTRYTTEVIANQMQMLGPGGGNNSSPAASAHGGGSSPQAAPDFDDDIPF